MIHQLVYYSRNVVAGNDRSMLMNLRDIVSASQRNNSRDGITGFLIFDKTWFIQVLEGDQAQVSSTYTRIARDPRHTSATILDARNVQGRSFPNWTMGGAMRNPRSRRNLLAAWHRKLHRPDAPDKRQGHRPRPRPSGFRCRETSDSAARELKSARPVRVRCLTRSDRRHSNASTRLRARTRLASSPGA